MDKEREHIVRGLWKAICVKHTDENDIVHSTDAAVELAEMIMQMYEKQFEGLTLEKKSEIYLGS